MTSPAAAGSQTTNYLFDFLYLDRNRIASYCAQLFDGGVLTGVKSVSASQDASTDKGSVGVTGFFGYEGVMASTATESIERQYDAAWSMPLNIIHSLSENNYIVDDITQAAMGQIILFEGGVQFIDLRMIQGMWDKIIRIQLAEIAPKLRKQSEQDMKRLAELISELPHTLQMKVFSDVAQLWATLTPEYLIVNPSDLALKHGSKIPGQWHVLAVLDARPDDGGLPSARNHTPVEEGMLTMLNVLREMLGRSPSDYGVTPLAIFRPIRPRAKQ